MLDFHISTSPFDYSRHIHIPHIKSRLKFCRYANFVCSIFLLSQNRYIFRYAQNSIWYEFSLPQGNISSATAHIEPSGISRILQEFISLRCSATQLRDIKFRCTPFWCQVHVKLGEQWIIRTSRNITKSKISIFRRTLILASSY